MKKIGLIGGVSYQSSIEYYRLINQEINRLLGKFNTAHILIESFNFNDVFQLMLSDKWDIVENLIVGAASRLEAAGADFLAISCNSLHKVAPAIERFVNIPLIHILEPIGLEIKKHAIKKVGLMGARFTMDNTFHSEYLQNYFGIETIMPFEEEKEIIEKIILDELCFSIITEKSRKLLDSIIYSMQKRGAQGIILGCTELPLLLPLTSEKDIPIFDTTELHSHAIARFAIEEKKILKDKKYSNNLQNQNFLM